MIEFMIYPVSAIMKFWHYVFTSWMGMETSTAWLISIFGLIVTVRSIVAPTTWMQMKSGRTAQLLKPRMTELQRQFEERTDADAVKWHQEQRKALHKENSYSPMAGCLPALIQFPVFIGLYQVLLRMARPAEGLDAAHNAIGFLTPDDVSEFIQVRFMDVPLPAYIAMSAEQFSDLGTTREATTAVVLPLVIAACIFTAINMAFSTWRGYRTLDWDSKFSVGLTKFLASWVLLIPLMLIGSALTGPLPLAIMLYWFGGNLWTMGQFFVLTYLLETKYPLTAEFIEMRESSKARYKARKQELKPHKRFVNKHRALMVLQPHKIGSHYKTIINAKAEVREARLAETAQKRENAKLRRQAQKDRMAQRRAEKKAAKQSQAHSTNEHESADATAVARTATEKAFDEKPGRHAAAPPTPEERATSEERNPATQPETPPEGSTPFKD